MAPFNNTRLMLVLIALGIVCLCGVLLAPKPYYILPGLVAIGLMVWLFIALSRAMNHAAKHPFIGRRFRMTVSDGMGFKVRSEKWGIITDVESGKCQRGEIYDGHASAKVRQILVERGQDTWARVRYDDGSESWEPCWWFVDKATHLEYQT